MQRALIAAAMLLSSTAAGFAQDIVSATEINTMLAGNTAVGTWNGDPYRQFFAKDGSTIYASKGARPTLGKWRVNTANHTYESWWERTAWTAYRIIRPNGQLYWTNAQGQNPQPFEMLPGQQMHWPKN